MSGGFASRRKEIGAALRRPMWKGPAGAIALEWPGGGRLSSPLRLGLKDDLWCTSFCSVTVITVLKSNLRR